MARRKRKGLPVVFDGSSDWPIIATERGDSRACRRAAGSSGFIGIGIPQGETGGHSGKYSPPTETRNTPVRTSSCRAHDNVRRARVPVACVAVIVAPRPLWAAMRGREMKHFAFAPLATALVGLGVVIFAS